MKWRIRVGKLFIGKISIKSIFKIMCLISLQVASEELRFSVSHPSAQRKNFTNFSKYDFNSVRLSNLFCFVSLHVVYFKFNVAKFTIVSASNRCLHRLFNEDEMLLVIVANTTDETNGTITISLLIRMN